MKTAIAQEMIERERLPRHMLSYYALVNYNYNCESSST